MEFSKNLKKTPVTCKVSVELKIENWKHYHDWFGSIDNDHSFITTVAMSISLLVH